jgi:hypothetical protein
MLGGLLRTKSVTTLGDVTALKMDKAKRVVSWIMVMESLTASTSSIPNTAKLRYALQFKKL